MNTNLQERRELEFDPTMFKSQRRNELFTRMAVRTAIASDDRRRIDHFALSILPPFPVDYIQSTCNGVQERLHAEIEVGMLCIARIHTIAHTPDPCRKEALEGLNDFTPLDPLHPVFAIEFTALIDCFPDNTISISVRQRAAELINKLCSRLPDSPSLCNFSRWSIRCEL